MIRLQFLALLILVGCVLSSSAEFCDAVGDGGFLNGRVYENSPDGFVVLTPALNGTESSVILSLTGELTQYFDISGINLTVKNSGGLSRSNGALTRDDPKYVDFDGQVVCLGDDGSASSHFTVVRMFYTNLFVPVVSSSSTKEQTEYTTIGTVVHTIQGDDGDGTDYPLLYTITVQTPADFFKIESNGDLVLIKDLDYEVNTEHFLTIKVSDDGYDEFGNSVSRNNSQNLTVTILNYDDIPPIFSYNQSVYSANFSTNEIGLLANVEPEPIKAIDGDGLGAAIAYRIPDILINGEKKFEIDNTTGVVSVINEIVDEDTYTIPITAYQIDRPSLFSMTFLQIAVSQKDENKPNISSSAILGNVISDATITNDGSDIIYVKGSDGNEIRLDVSDIDDTNANSIYTIEPQGKFQVDTSGFIFGRSDAVFPTSEVLQEYFIKAINLDASIYSNNRESDPITLKVQVIEMTTPATTEVPATTPMMTTQEPTQESTTEEVDETTITETTTAFEFSTSKVTTIDSTTSTDTTLVGFTTVTSSTDSATSADKTSAEVITSKATTNDQITSVDTTTSDITEEVTSAEPSMPTTLATSAAVTTTMAATASRVTASDTTPAEVTVETTSSESSMPTVLSTEMSMSTLAPTSAPTVAETTSPEVTSSLATSQDATRQSTGITTYYMPIDETTTVTTSTVSEMTTVSTSDPAATISTLTSLPAELSSTMPTSEDSKSTALIISSVPTTQSPINPTPSIPIFVTTSSPTTVTTSTSTTVTTDSSAPEPSSTQSSDISSSTVIALSVEMVPKDTLVGVAAGLSSALFIAILVIIYLLCKLRKNSKEEFEDNKSEKTSVAQSNNAYNEVDEREEYNGGILAHPYPNVSSFRPVDVANARNAEENEFEGKDEHDGKESETVIEPTQQQPEREANNNEEVVTVHGQQAVAEARSSSFESELMVKANEMSAAAAVAAAVARKAERPSTSNVSAQFKAVLPPEVVKIDGVIKENAVRAVKIATLKRYGDDATDVKVVLRTIDTDMATSIDVNKVKKQIAILAEVSERSHPNILTYYGSYKTDDAIHYAVRFAENGNLRDKLASHSLDSNNMMHIMAQIASGLQYLHAKNITHGHIWAKSVMLDDMNTPMLTDIEGSSWPSSEYKEIMRWQAIEVIKQMSSCTPVTDVWSYGTLMWEIVSQGATPYANVPLQDLEKTMDQQRLQRPQGCSESLFSIMESCWKKDPKLRPDMYVISGNLGEKLLEDSNEHICLELNRKPSFGLDDNTFCITQEQFQSDSESNVDFTAF